MRARGAVLGPGPLRSGPGAAAAVVGLFARPAASVSNAAASPNAVRAGLASFGRPTLFFRGETDGAAEAGVVVVAVATTTAGEGRRVATAWPVLGRLSGAAGFESGRGTADGEEEEEGPAARGLKANAEGAACFAAVFSSGMRA